MLKHEASALKCLNVTGAIFNPRTGELTIYQELINQIRIGDDKSKPIFRLAIFFNEYVNGYKNDVPIIKNKLRTSCKCCS